MMTALILTLSQISMAEPSSGGQDYPAELLEWADEKANWLEERFLAGIDDVDRLREYQRAQKRIQKALGKELIACYEMVESVSEETPWLIRVNQGTNTVTIYRVLQAAQEEVPFRRTLNSIVQEAANAEDDPEDSEDGIWHIPAGTESGEPASAGDTSGAAGDGSGIPGDAAEDAGDETQPQLRELTHEVLGQLRKDKGPEEESAEMVTVTLPVYSCPCSVGIDNGTPNGTFTINDHLRWHELVGPTWGQWCCHFAPSYLFHSLPYDRPNDPNSLETDAYNQIGQAVSHGCVRLAAVDAKYIYDHAPSGTKVEIFTGDADDDPLGTPQRPYVGEWDKNYDPTDPEYQPEETGQES